MEVSDQLQTPGKVPSVYIGYEAGWALDDMEKRKFLTLPGLELRILCLPVIASRYTDCIIPAPENSCTNEIIVFLDRIHRPVFI
jgi:hypothetical protein